MSETPLDERARAMQNFGVFWCPFWCTQDPQEHQWEEHVSQWSELVIEDDRVSVRGRFSWFEVETGGSEPRVEIRSECAGEDGLGVWFGADALQRFHAMIGEVEEMLEAAAYSDAGWKSAYPGAVQDAHNAAHEGEVQAFDEEGNQIAAQLL